MPDPIFSYYEIPLSLCCVPSRSAMTDNKEAYRQRLEAVVNTGPTVADPEGLYAAEAARMLAHLDFTPPRYERVRYIPPTPTTQPEVKEEELVCV